MSDILKELVDLDHVLISQLQESELKAEEVVLLVDRREQILQNIYDEQNSDPGLRDSPEWEEALVRTRKVVILMQRRTNEIGEQLRRFRHGSKSIQRYQQFL